MNLKPNGRAYRPRGTTLVELLVVVAIVGILAALAGRYQGKDSRARAFAATLEAIVVGTTTARCHAITSGQRTFLSLENGAVTAFVDNDGDGDYGAADTVLYRYPQNAAEHLLPGQSATSVTLRELGTTTQRAVFDGRGFYIDGYSGTAAHDSNICVRDAQTGDEVNVQLSRFGWAGVTDVARCSEQEACGIAGVY